MRLSKGSGQWIVGNFYNNSFAGPLPELPLGSPKLSSIATFDEGIAFSFSSFFRFFHGVLCKLKFNRLRLRPNLSENWGRQTYPNRETSDARQRSGCKRLKANIGEGSTRNR